MNIVPSFQDLTYRLVGQPEGGVHARPPVKREEWTWCGQLHSIDDHPAVVINDGEERQWYAHGMRHRDETVGPAWILDRPGNTQISTYYSLGEIHRHNGPAMIFADYEKWYCRGKIHRADGPAILRKHMSDHGLPMLEWAWRGNKFISLDVWAEFSRCDPELHTMLKLQYG